MGCNRHGELTDESIFPFGKYKASGTKMKDVPSSYLDWLAGTNWFEDWPNLVEYIKENRQAIDMDLREEGRI